MKKLTFLVFKETKADLSENVFLPPASFLEVTKNPAHDLVSAMSSALRVRSICVSVAQFSLKQKLISMDSPPLAGLCYYARFLRGCHLREARVHPVTLKDLPHKPPADERDIRFLPVTSCCPPRPHPFTRPMDQHYRVLWTEGFSAKTRLLCSSRAFELNLSCSSALSAYSSSDTLHALTFLLPSCSQPLSSTNAASKTHTPTTLLQPHFCTSGRAAPEHPSSEENTSDGPSLSPSSKCNQSSFSSFHILLRCIFQPFPTTPRHPTSASPLPPALGACGGTVGFFVPQTAGPLWRRPGAGDI